MKSKQSIKFHIRFCIINFRYNLLPGIFIPNYKFVKTVYIYLPSSEYFSFWIS